MRYIETILTWCSNNGLTAHLNNEVFFLDENNLFKPKIIVNKNTYIDIIREKDDTVEYRKKCELFSKGFHKLIVIYDDALNDLNNITINDITDKFGFNI